MKKIPGTICLLLSCLISYSQQFIVNGLYFGNSWGHSYYVAKNDTCAFVFEMGKYIEKTGSGPAIRSMDTLYLQDNRRSQGRYATMLREKGQTYLVTGNAKKGGMITLKRVADTVSANRNLNNAWFLDSFCYV